MKYIKKVSASYQGDTPIATSISSSSTNDEVAGAKAVYDLIKVSKARYVLGSNLTITPVTSYTPVEMKLNEESNNDPSTFTYDSSTGYITVLKSGKYKFKFTTQLRASSNDALSCVAMKGIGIRTYRGNTNVDTQSMAEQTYLPLYTSMYQELITSLQAGDSLRPIAYSRIIAGNAGSTTTQVWASNRTSIEIELIEETNSATLNSISPSASLMNTGSLVGMGDRTELETNEIEKQKATLDEVDEVKQTNEEASGDTLNN